MYMYKHLISHGKQNETLASWIRGQGCVPKFGLYQFVNLCHVVAFLKYCKYLLVLFFSVTCIIDLYYFD